MRSSWVIETDVLKFNKLMFIPSLLLESVVGVVSRMLNIEAAESLALLVSGAKALVLLNKKKPAQICGEN